MRKKGFTLVELLAVIIIIGLIGIIVIPNINNSLKNADNNLNKHQINTIINATKKYIVENTYLLPDNNNKTNITISTLIEAGIIESDNSNLQGCIEITYDANYNQYIYNYVESCVD